jgi:DNA-binding NarL/FixJ family response regulator
MDDPTIQAKAISVQTQEEERYRLANLLQASLAQLLSNATLEIETCLQLMDADPKTARDGLTTLLHEIRHGLTDVHMWIRELQPPLLKELGLVPSLRRYADDFSKQTGIALTLTGWAALTERIPETLEIALFRIIQEALDNVREHAHASQAEVKLDLTPEELVVTIADNGQGFDVSQGIVPGRRLGLVAMRDRADLLAGSLQIFSEPGRGARVVLTAPRARLLQPIEVSMKAKNSRKKKVSPAGIRLMIVDDHPLFRAGLRRVLEMEPGFEIVGEAINGQEALDKARELEPQVILMDVNLPVLNGLQATRELTASRDDIAVVVLTAYHDDEQMLHAIRAGASAYFPKDVDPQELVRAVHEVSKGNYMLNDAVLAKPQVATWLLNQFDQMQVTGGDSAEMAFQPLSTREMEILTLITHGKSNKEIAQQLGISRQTVKNHMTSILRKLAVNDRTQAAVYALRRGWIRLQDVPRG